MKDLGLRLERDHTAGGADVFGAAGFVSHGRQVSRVYQALAATPITTAIVAA